MTSSRWKRFAFFDRQNLNLTSEILEDLIPVEGSAVRKSRGGSTPGSNNASNPSGTATNDSVVSLVVSTVALPLKSRPKANNVISDSDAIASDGAPLTDMWTSLNACTMPRLEGIDDDEDPDARASIRLPSQAQYFEDDSNVVVASEHAVDGLVLAFLTSRETDHVHCFDLTLRCNPPDTTKTTLSTHSTTATESLEDMDGWRGYFAPFKTKRRHAGVPSTAGSAGTTLEDRLISDDMQQDAIEGIVHIASCRTATGHRPLHMACITKTNVVVCVDPHLFLSCRRPLATPDKLEASTFLLGSEWNIAKDGTATVVDIVPGIVAVGTDNGRVQIFTYTGGRHVLRPYLTIPPPHSSGMAVSACKLSVGPDKASVFVGYRRSSTSSSPRNSTAGVSCFDMPLPGPNPFQISAPSARHDLDGRQVPSSGLCGAVSTSEGVMFTVARPDGLYTYSTTQKIDVSPIDGSKLAMCLVPPPENGALGRDHPAVGKAGPSFALVASTDLKSQRDAVDIYDSTNKLVAFHLLLSPGHSAVRTAGVTTSPTRSADGTLRNGKSSAIVFTSGGSLVSFTEKKTAEKVHLLVQKNLFSAAIYVAYGDPSYEPADIIALYRKHAEYLYRKGDYSGAIEQYIYTIGALEPSHVIFRYLDAPKIPLLVKYLEELRSRDKTTQVHNELLRTCYLKLNDPEAAESIAAFTSRSMDTESLSSVVTSSPKDALAMICSFEAPQAAEALATHGASLSRLLPRETAGLVVSLCLGTFSPKKFAELSSTAILADAKKILGHSWSEGVKECEQYPVHLFASAFMENARMLRLILSHCNRHRCPLTPSLRRTLLELTLAEWNQAKRKADTEGEKVLRKEAITALTDSHSREIGDYDALVIVQLAGFEEGELLLYERLQMGPMLLSRYARDGSEKARRQMLAMCESDPEILADVLGHFVAMVSSNSKKNPRQEKKARDSEDDSDDDEVDEILYDIQEALSLARRQGVLPPVRIARILAGEGTSQFSSDSALCEATKERTVPLLVALDYVGAVLDESRKEINRLKSEVEEYNQVCNRMEAEVESLLRASQAIQSKPEETASKINVEEMYTKVRMALDEDERTESVAELSRESFWREMDQTEDTFQTIARYFAKGVIQ